MVAIFIHGQAASQRGERPRIDAEKVNFYITY